MTLDKDHYLVSRHGTFDTSGSPHATTQADLDSLFSTLATDKNRDRLVLRFHGGLVDFESGMLAAEDITKRYADLAAYQVFFLWQTALFDVLSEETFLDAICPNISQAFNDPFFQQVLLRVTQFVKGKVDAANGGVILKAPYTLSDVQIVFSYLNKYQTSHVWSLSSGGDGISSDAKSHATFYSEAVTMNSVKYAIEHGLHY